VDINKESEQDCSISAQCGDSTRGKLCGIGGDTQDGVLVRVHSWSRLSALWSNGPLNQINVFDVECADRLREPLSVDWMTWAEGQQCGVISGTQGSGATRTFTLNHSLGFHCNVPVQGIVNHCGL
jgi:hypothetical protein